MKDRSVTFSWNAVAGATGYVLEIGRSLTGTDVAVITIEGANTTYQAANMPAGISFARVRARDASTTSSPGNELRFIVPDLRDVIEGLFLGTGPHRYILPGGGGETARPYMLGWRQGTVPTRVAGANDQEYGYVEQILQQLDEVTNGVVKGAVVQRLGDAGDLSSAGVPGEFKFIFSPDMLTYCGNATVGGCGGAQEDTTAANPGNIRWSRIVMKTPAALDVVAHEAGHAILGLKHIQWAAWTSLGEAAWPGLPQPTMFGSASPGGGSLLTPTEADAIKAAYSAGLRGGATRSAFFAAGLINNP